MGKKKKLEQSSSSIITINRKATFDYTILEKKEAGIVLTGNEVKACRQRKVSLVDTYCRFIKRELFLINVNISPYQSHQYNYTTKNNTRPRKLLLHKSELDKLYAKTHEKGLTVIPLSLYLKGNRIKIELALVHGKKKYDKRESIKKRDEERQLRREFKEKINPGL